MEQDLPCSEQCGVPLACCGKPCAARCHSCQEVTLVETESDSQDSSDTESDLQDSPDPNVSIQRIKHVSHICEKIYDACGHPCGQTCTDNHECGRCLARCVVECGHRRCPKACSDPCMTCKYTVYTDGNELMARRTRVLLVLRTPEVYSALLNGMISSKDSRAIADS